MIVRKRYPLQPAFREDVTKAPIVNQDSDNVPMAPHRPAGTQIAAATIPNMQPVITPKQPGGTSLTDVSKRAIYEVNPLTIATTNTGGRR